MEYGTNGGVDTTDKVYLLSIAEASNSAYGFDSEFYEDSETRVAMNSIGEAGFWLLRSPGRYSASVALVNSVGYGYGYGGISTDTFSVRPALHLNLSSSSLWRYAGKVSSDGSVDLPTPSPTNTPAPVYSFRRGIDNNSFCHNNGNDSNWYCPYNAKYETDTKYL